MSDLKITALTTGTPKSTDFHVAVDTTDSTMAPTGTDKKYLLSTLSQFILKSGADIVTKFVSSTGGVDAVGNGGITSPYATPEYMYSQILDASASKIYVIKMSGNFSSTTISIKPWIYIDGQNSIWNITNPLVAHASFMSGGGNSVIENFSSFNTVGGVNIDLSGAPSSYIKINNVTFMSSTPWTITGNSSETTVSIIENSFGLGLTPDITIKNCFGGALNVSPKGITFLSDSATQTYNFSLIESSLENEFLIQVDTGAQGATVDIRSSRIGGGLRIKSVAAAPVTVLQGPITNLAGITLDGTGIIYKPESQTSSITLLNGATISTNVVYPTISDGMTANFTPVNYTPTTPQVKGHLEGIDAVLGGSGTGFLESVNNLSDVASVSTSRTNLGLGTMAVQNANSVAITGGSITGTTYSKTISAASDFNLSHVGGVFLRFNTTDSLLMNGGTIQNATINGNVITSCQFGGGTINSSTIGITTPAAAKFTTTTITSLAPTAGVVHNDTAGLLSSSLIVNADITAATITNAKLANMASHTFKGNNTGGSTVPLDLTISQMQSELGIPGTLGTMSLQNANAVAITGGSINNSSIGAVTPHFGRFTLVGITTFLTAGIVHNDSAGDLSTSLIVNADITASTITNAKLANMAAHTFKGNNTGSAAAPSDLTIVQLQTELALGSIAFQNFGSVNITGGSINGVTIDNSPIGNTTRSTGKFTTLDASTGLTLPTSGGTPSTLNYYEELDTTIAVSGPWASQNLSVKFTRIGRLCSLSWAALSVAITSASQKIASAAGAIPTRFRPAGSAQFAEVINGGTSITEAPGIITFLSGGGFLFATEGDNNFGVTGFAGVAGGAVSYVI